MFAGKRAPNRRIFFAGDGQLSGAAACAASVIIDCGFLLDHVPSNEMIEEDFDPSQYSLIIFSDYSAQNIPVSVQSAIYQYINGGGSFLMIGGFLSFAGEGADYFSSRIADLLPVILNGNDDRRNVPQGIVPRATNGVFDSMNWSSPPVICGYNCLYPRDGAKILLDGRPLMIGSDSVSFGTGLVPLCLRQTIGRGLSTALAFDLAPHWVGGFIDWGTERIALEGAGRIVEMGNFYREFVSILIESSINKGV